MTFQPLSSSLFLLLQDNDLWRVAIYRGEGRIPVLSWRANKVALVRGARPNPLLLQDMVKILRFHFFFPTFFSISLLFCLSFSLTLASFLFPYVCRWEWHPFEMSQIFDWSMNSFGRQDRRGWWWWRYQTRRIRCRDVSRGSLSFSFLILVSFSSW